MLSSKLKTFKLGGVHPEENKFSATAPIIDLAPGPTVYIPVGQHIGTPAKAIVAKGDKVLTGQLIAQAEGFISANVHSSVSGTVKAVSLMPDASGMRKMVITIDVEGDEWLPEIDRTPYITGDPTHYSAEHILKRVQEAGIVGLGGATFPSHVKMNVPKGKTAEYFILNGVECEPYLTADHRIMLEKGPELIAGIRLGMKAIGVNKAIIGIEENKSDAIEQLRKLAREYPNIEVAALKVQYPQGGEKQLIEAVTGRAVPPGKLPIEVGCVVMNVGSTIALYEAVCKNKPLIERVVTVTGKSLARPSNYMVRIGTPAIRLIEAAGGLPDNVGKIVNGGPMMGKAVSTLDLPVTKGSSGFIVFDEKESKREEFKPCIRCGKCVDVCPQGLQPYLLAQLGERKILDRAEEENVTDCIECGSCSFTCPSYRPLLDHIRIAKSNVIKIIRSRTTSK